MKLALALGAALIGLAGSAYALEAGAFDTKLYPLPVHAGGKVAHDEDGYAYQWPGIYFESRFHGTQAAVLFDDPNANYNVILDGKLLEVVMKPGTAMWNVSAVDGDHTLRIEKRSETQYATGRFGGFYVPQKAEILPAPTHAHQIEFIGDSLTVGYGNTSQYTQCSTDEIFQSTDAQEGFGPTVAKHYDADYQINAFSGLGMVRNYGGYEHPKYHMPMLYPRAVFDDPTPAPRQDWAPQVIVIGIGGNDFSTPVKAGEPWADEAALLANYEATYIQFVKDVRAANPQAFLILTSPDGRDGYTNGTTDVYNAIVASGETRIARLTIPPLDATGCNGHPNTRDDQKVAQMFIAWFDAHPEVWAGK